VLTCNIMVLLSRALINNYQVSSVLTLDCYTSLFLDASTGKSVTTPRQAEHAVFLMRG
jgi:hypothetical protein